MSAVGIIPARYASSRFPGKPLAMIAGLPMLQRVYEGARRAKRLRDVLVATDDARIAEACRGFGAHGAADAPGPPDGHRPARRGEPRPRRRDRGERPGRRAADRGLRDRRRGRGPRGDPRGARWRRSCTAPSPRTLADPNRVKVVLDRRGFALYFSRAPIPHRRDEAAEPPLWQHVGLYAYRRDFLQRYVALPRTPLEQAEALEQLRALEHGYPIRVAVVEGWRSVPVDVPADVAKVEEILPAPARPLAAWRGRPRARSPFAVALLLFLLSGAGALVVETTWLRWLRGLLGATAPAASATLVAFFLGQALGAAAGARLAPRARRDPSRSTACSSSAPRPGPSRSRRSSVSARRALRGVYDAARGDAGAARRAALRSGPRGDAARLAGLRRDPAGARRRVRPRAPAALGRRGTRALRGRTSSGAALGTALASFWLPDVLGVRAGHACGVAALARRGRRGAPRSRGASRRAPARSRREPRRRAEAADGIPPSALRRHRRPLGLRLLRRRGALHPGLRPGARPVGVRLRRGAGGRARRPRPRCPRGCGARSAGPRPRRRGARRRARGGRSRPRRLPGALLRGDRRPRVPRQPAPLARLPRRRPRRCGGDGGARAPRRGPRIPRDPRRGGTARVRRRRPRRASAASRPPTPRAPWPAPWRPRGCCCRRSASGPPSACSAPSTARRRSRCPSWRPAPASSLPALLAGGAAALVAFANPWSVPPLRLAPGERLVSIEATPAGVVAVVESRGRPAASRSTTTTPSAGARQALHEERQAHLALALRPGARRVAWIGSATGISPGAALAHPLERLALVELVPGVARAARRHFAPWNRGVYDDPRSEVVLDDGRNFVRATAERFDAIVADLFVPWQAGAASLYAARALRSRARAPRAGGALLPVAAPLPARRGRDPDPPRHASSTCSRRRRCFAATSTGASRSSPSSATRARLREPTRSRPRPRRLAAAGDPRPLGDPSRRGSGASTSAPSRPLAASLAGMPRNRDDVPASRVPRSAQPRRGRAAREAPSSASASRASRAGRRAGRSAPSIRLFGPLGEARLRAAAGGHALQSADALYADGRAEESGQALAAAAALLPRELLADAAAGPERRLHLAGRGPGRSRALTRPVPRAYAPPVSAGF